MEVSGPFIITQHSRPYREEVGAPVEKLRVAWTTNPWQPATKLDSEVAGCVEQVASELGGEGYTGGFLGKKVSLCCTAF
jgi:hypothetical protein